MIRSILKGIAGLAAVLIVLATAAGAYAGNLAYNEFREAPWDQILGIRNNSRHVAPIRVLEKERQWEAVRVNAPDGTILRGTYIASTSHSHKTVILLHGLYQNRSMCLGYVPIYQNLGYNVLLIDQRGHGESEGAHTDWGLSEPEDMEMWMQWLRRKDPQAVIGLHGISLGAAMALLYAGSDRQQQVAFVIVDSSYGNIISMGREKLMDWTGDKNLVLGYDLLDPFFQAAMLVHTHKLVSSIEPAHAVHFIKVPVLFLHGSADTLVPVKTAQSLYDQCGSGHKYLHVFRDSPHAAAIETDRREYVRTVTDFLEENV